MKKDSKLICISKKKAWIVGLIISLIYALITSFAIAYTFLNAKLDVSNTSVSTLCIWLIPILFVLFGTCILAFIAMFSGQENKK